MQDTVAVTILAGGGGRRLGGADKALVEVAGRPMLAHALSHLRPQARRIVLSANGNPQRFEEFNLPVIADRVADAGPLAGIAAAAAYCASHWPECQHLVTSPVDVPQPPPDLVARLVAKREAAVEQGEGEVSVAEAGGRRHWTIACWPVAAALRLTTMVEHSGVRRIEDAAEALGFLPVRFVDASAFTNGNTPDDLEILRRMLTGN